MIFISMGASWINPKTAEGINNLLLQLSENAQRLSTTELKEILGKSSIDFLVVIEGNEIVGMGSIHYKETLIRKTGIIEDVVVDKSWRGKGIGEKIVRILINFAIDRNVDVVELTSKPERKEANALYEKLGFEKRETNFYRKNLR